MATDTDIRACEVEAEYLLTCLRETKFHRLSIGLIENILLVDTEGGGITGSRKMLQLGLRSSGKVDPSV